MFLCTLRRNYSIARCFFSSIPEFPRHYGPSPSDHTPSPNTLPQHTQPEKPTGKQKRRWSDAARAKLKDHILAQSLQGIPHPLEQWRNNNPLASAILSEVASRARKKENEERLLKFLTGCIPRKLNMSRPNDVRLVLFGKTFILHKLKGFRGFDWGDPTTVLVSLSISSCAPHPFKARRDTVPVNRRLDSIGIRVFGRNPTTDRPFDEWVATCDSVLERIVEVADSIEDQTMLQTICTAGLSKNLKGERWGF